MFWWCHPKNNATIENAPISTYNKHFNWCLLYIVSRYLFVLFTVMPLCSALYYISVRVLWRQREQHSHASQRGCFQSQWVLLITNHKITDQNRCPIRDHTLWGLCLCCDSTRCLFTVIYNYTVTCSLYCKCVSKWVFDAEWGWEIFHNFPLLLLVYTSERDATVVVSLCVHLSWASVVLHCVVTGWVVRRGRSCSFTH